MFNFPGFPSDLWVQGLSAPPIKEGRNYIFAQPQHLFFLLTPTCFQQEKKLSQCDVNFLIFSITCM